MSGSEKRVDRAESVPGQQEKLRIAVLVSGSGSNLQALIDAIADGQLPNVEIALVISNKARAYGLQRALEHRLPAIFVPWTSREETEARITALLQLFAVDLIVRAIERYLAEFRDVFREDGGCLQMLIRVLDLFVDVGWPSARRLAYQIDGIFQ